MSQLLVLERERDIRARLGSLPKDLKATYDDIYATIQKQEGSKPEVAIRALQWVIASSIDLRADIVLAAVCQSADDMELQQIDVSVDFILSSCQNLLVLDQANTFRLSHISVCEYLEDNHPQLILDGISLAAYICLRLLINPNNWMISAGYSMPIQYVTSTPAERIEIEEVETRYLPANHESLGLESIQLDSELRREVSNIRRAHQNPTVGPGAFLIDYARFSWPHHCHAMEDIDDHTFTALELEFLGSIEASGTAYRRWYHTLEATYLRNRFESKLYPHLDILEPVTSILPPICLFGLKKALEEVGSKVALPTSFTTERGLSLLVLAVMGGHKQMVEFLLENDADVNALQFRGSGSALATAADRGDEKIVRILLENGADVNAYLQSPIRSALAIAARRPGNEATVRVLLEHGADVNHTPMGSFYEPPLSRQ